VKHRRAVPSLLDAPVTALVVWSAGTGEEAPDPPADRLSALDASGLFGHQQDGSGFGDVERHLPSRPRGHYTEYTVDTPSSADRGARRIAAGRGGDFYSTCDHHSLFARIIR
jgi:ribonuclease T1